jgi:hypothetical protein
MPPLSVQRAKKFWLRDLTVLRKQVRMDGMFTLLFIQVVKMTTIIMELLVIGNCSNDVVTCKE